MILHNSWAKTAHARTFYEVICIDTRFTGKYTVRIRNCTRNPSGIFPMSSVVRTPFPALIRLKMASKFCLFVRKITWRLADTRFIFSWWKHYSTNGLIFFSTQNKIHIFPPPCNMSRRYGQGVWHYGNSNQTPVGIGKRSRWENIFETKLSLFPRL